MSGATVDKPKPRKNGGSDGVSPKTAYISAPRTVDVSYVRKTLEEKGVHTFSPDQLDLPGQNLSQVLLEGMRRADLVVAVVDPTPDSNFVFYELGFAQALRKPTIVLLTRDVSPSTWNLSGVPYLRFDPANPTGLDFGITQFLNVPHHGTKAPKGPVRRTHPIGKRAEGLLARLRADGNQMKELELVAIIEEALRESGVTTVSKGSPQDNYVDLAVWADDLSPWVGNPLPIELRGTLRGTADVKAAVENLLRAMATGGMPWGLLIYLRADKQAAKVIPGLNVLCISAEEFLGALRNTSFGDLIRRLRNERVHKDT
jgi:hypothetical protein